ncbi:MAG: HEPN domain-containing protein [Salinivirgaceae bacterium]
MGEFLEQHLVLYKKGVADFNAAKILFEQFNQGNRELDIDIILFHLQQSAEKLIKAILSKQKVNFPKIHDLEQLYYLLQSTGIEVSVDIELIIQLNDYAVEGRYAIIHDEVLKTEEYFKTISILTEFTKNLFNE